MFFTETAQRKFIQLKKHLKEALALQYLAICTDMSVVWKWAADSGIPPAEGLIGKMWKRLATSSPPQSDKLQAFSAVSKFQMKCLATVQMFLNASSLAVHYFISLICWKTCLETEADRQRKKKHLERLIVVQSRVQPRCPHWSSVHVVFHQNWASDMHTLPIHSRMCNLQNNVDVWWMDILILFSVIKWWHLYTCMLIGSILMTQALWHNAPMVAPS